MNPDEVPDKNVNDKTKLVGVVGSVEVRWEVDGMNEIVYVFRTMNGKATEDGRGASVEFSLTAGEVAALAGLLRYEVGLK